MEKESMNWTMILEVVGVVGGIATIIALMLGPMFYLGAKIENFKNIMHQDMKEFREELKQCHSRMSILEDRYLRAKEKID